MAWKHLPTDFTDAVWSGLKRYTQIDNSDGTVSFRDDTTYTGKEKSFFGAKDANRMNDALNVIMSMLENGTDLYELFQSYFAQQKTLFQSKVDTEYGSYQAYVDSQQQEIDTIVEAIRNSTDTEYANYEKYLQDHKDEIAAAVTGLKTQTDTEYANYEKYLQDHKDEIAAAVAELKSLTDTEYANYEKYLQDHKDEIAAAVAGLKTLTDTEYADFTAYVQNLEQQGDTAIDSIKTDYRKEIDDFQTSQEQLFNAWFDAIRSRLSGDVATSLQDQIDGLNDKVAGFVGKQTVFSADGKSITEISGDTKLLVTFNDDGSITEQQVKGGIIVKTKKTTFSADGLEIKEEVT